MLNPDFKEFIQSLNDNDVRYLIVGGYAVAFHGYPRYTKDIDIWIDDIEVNVIDIENLKKSKLAAGRTQDLADVENSSG